MQKEYSGTLQGKTAHNDLLSFHDVAGRRHDRILRGGPFGAFVNGFSYLRIPVKSRNSLVTPFRKSRHRFSISAASFHRTKDLGIGPKPGFLAFGVHSGVPNGPSNRLLQVDLSVKVRIMCR